MPAIRAFLKLLTVLTCFIPFLVLPQKAMSGGECPHLCENCSASACGRAITRLQESLTGHEIDFNWLNEGPNRGIVYLPPSAALAFQGALICHGVPALRTAQSIYSSYEGDLRSYNYMVKTRGADEANRFYGGPPLFDPSAFGCVLAPVGTRVRFVARAYGYPVVEWREFSGVIMPGFVALGKTE